MTLPFAQIPPNYSVDSFKLLNKLTASLHPHYKGFITTTSQSAPVAVIGTFPLAGDCLRVSLSIQPTGSYVPRKSLPTARAIYVPDAV